jgi:uncharacterized C2H2 Zn-finger protein
MIYEGAGILKCPKCGAIVDYSENTYKVSITRKSEEGVLYTEIDMVDSRLKKYVEPEEDFYDLFSDLPVGQFECEVYYLWYQEGPEYEWDCETYLFQSEEIENDKRTNPKP